MAKLDNTLNQNSKEEKFLEALQNSYLYQHVKEPTWSHGLDKPSIDLIFTNEDCQVYFWCTIVAHLVQVIIVFCPFLSSVALILLFQPVQGDFNTIRHYVMHHNCFKDIANAALGNQNDVSLLWNKMSSWVMKQLHSQQNLQISSPKR